ncbi:hypothetical protein [Nonomuraea roseola]|uniref:Uncharacterized protein n=1 Tax=Nonomuraea roseola TaxID=46179 RepID=A0ABV5QGC7_9ACTN
MEDLAFCDLQEFFSICRARCVPEASGAGRKNASGGSTRAPGRAADYDQHVEEATLIFHPMLGGVALFIPISVSLCGLFPGRP